MSDANRDVIFALCEAVAELAVGTAHLLGTGRGGEIVRKMVEVSERLDDACPSCDGTGKANREVEP